MVTIVPFLISTLHASEVITQEKINSCVSFFEDIQNNPTTFITEAKINSQKFIKKMAYQQAILANLIGSSADEFFAYMHGIKKLDKIINLQKTYADTQGYVNTIQFVAMNLKITTIKPYIQLLKLQSNFHDQKKKSSEFPTLRQYKKLENLSRIDTNLAKSCHSINSGYIDYLQIGNPEIASIFDQFRFYQTENTITLKWKVSKNRENLFKTWTQDEKQKTLDALFKPITIFQYALEYPATWFNPTENSYKQEEKRAFERFYDLIQDAFVAHNQTTHDAVIKELQEYAGYCAFLIAKRLPQDNQLSIIEQYLMQFYKSEFETIKGTLS
jgi:hypothetical protein